jgi:hypothetical protein
MPLTNRVDKFVDDAENNSAEWSDKQWEMSMEEYEKLLEEYETNYDSLTKEEKNAINKAIARYNGLMVKRGIEDAGQAIKEFGEQIPSMVEGFFSAFTDDEE